MEKLPIYDIKNLFLQSINNNNRILLKAPTGSGKSTQIPQILLDNCDIKGKILILQPRRIAARMVAMRVASERGTSIGEEIGYQTRFEKNISDKTKVHFITEGILPRMLISDQDLENVAVVIFDEFHERSLTVDFGLALVKNLQERCRPDLKIIIMSATIETGPVTEYLPQTVTIESEGKSYPVEVEYRSPTGDKLWDAALDAVKYLLKNTSDGDILIFMPGVYEIRRTAQKIRDASLGEAVQVFMLYGDLPLDQQNKVMEKVNKRKIIVSTNIAETSLTIPGVRHVIDSGLARCSKYDEEKGFNGLYIEKIALDSADQRKGRAGRESSGRCIRLWSESDHSKRAKRSIPEIFRVDLSEIVLQLVVMKHKDMYNFDWIEPPEKAKIDNALKLLKKVNAIDSNMSITADGLIMVNFPMHPRLSRLLIESNKLGISRTGAFAAAILSERPVIFEITDSQKEFKNSFTNDFHFIAFLSCRVIESDYDLSLANQLGINISALKQVLRTTAFFLQILRKGKMHTRDTSDDIDALSKALLFSYNDRFAKRCDCGTLKCYLSGGFTAEIAKESCVRHAQFLVASTIRTIVTRDGAKKNLITLASEVKKEWLFENFPALLIEKTECRWNSIIQEVESWKVKQIFDIIVEEEKLSQPILECSGDLLAKIIIEKKLKMNGWNSEVQELLNRFEWVRAQISSDLTKQEIYEKSIKDLCKNQFKYNAIKDIPLLLCVKNVFSEHELSSIESLTPQYLTDKTGRRSKVLYIPDKTPVIRIKIDDIENFESHPNVNGVDLIIEIIGPDNKKLISTNNLGEFKSKFYPDLMQKLRKKNPKFFKNKN